MQTPNNQKGLALLMLVFILALAVIGYVVSTLNSTSIQNDRNKKTAAVLAEAKIALLGSVIGRPNIDDRPYLPNPSLALIANSEGNESLAPLGGAVDVSLIGKFPWRSLGSHPYKDGWNECLWYVVSGRFKNTPETSVFNWDTQGQIDLIDKDGKVIANNLAALIIAPGPALAGQDRSLATSNSSHCGGNYDAKNYLDTFNVINAVSGEVNYFSGSANGGVAPDTLNKVFVLANNDYYNDRVISLTSDDIFDSLIKRSDFVNEVNLELNNAADDINIYSVLPFGDKGTGNIDCTVSGISTDLAFCQNWKDIFLLASGNKVNGVDCSKVFIFGGKKMGGQVRLTDDDKKDPANYLEGENVGAFNGEVGKVFTGSTVFDGNNPGADVLKCIL